MDNLIIRKASEKDLNTLLDFEQGIISWERKFDKTIKAGLTYYYDIHEMISSDNTELLVAEFNNEVIGSGYVRIKNSESFLQHRTYAYLGFIFVMPEYRGKGISSKIIEKLKLWANSRDITEVRLEVYQNNLSALKAYEKLGFIKHMIEMRMDTTDII